MQPNEIYISRGKPAINYVLAVQTQASQGYKKIYIRGRGNNINKAVDVAQVTVNRFLKNYKIENVKIGTEKFEKDDKIRSVSTIEILLVSK